MITLTDLNRIAFEAAEHFQELTIDDTFGMCFDIIWAEQLKDKGELQKLLFQYAQRLANS